MGPQSLISRIHLILPNAHKLMCFDRNINRNRDVKFLRACLKLTLVEKKGSIVGLFSLLGEKKCRWDFFFHFLINDLFGFSEV